MIPEVGSTALFTFTNRFESLDGIYRIRAETTFRDAVTAGVDFVANLYTPAGLAAADFNADRSGYLTDRIVVLESVRDASVVYYVPESVFGKIPDPTVKEYLPLTLVINLGAFKNTQVVYPLLEQITDLVQASVGVANPLYLLSNPENKLFLTDADYDALETARQDNIEKLVPLSVQVKQLTEDKVILAAKIAEYERLIKEQATV